MYVFFSDFTSPKRKRSNILKSLLYDATKNALKQDKEIFAKAVDPSES